MTLTQNQYYEATATGVALLFASNDKLKKLLEEKGFVNVVATGSGKVREVKGTWSKPTQPAPTLPGGVTVVFK